MSAYEAPLRESPRSDSEGNSITRRVNVMEQIVRGPAVGAALANELAETAERQAMVEAAVQQGAVTQAMTWEQVRDLQERLAQTCEALVGQHHAQLQLGAQQAHLENAGRSARQEERLDNMQSSLEEQRRGRDEERWGYFGRGPGDAEEAATKDAAAATPRLLVATSANMPQAPLYKGKSLRDKRAFMDAYIIYERKVRILNQSTGTQVYLMPVRGCIDHKTLVRICKYEMKKSEEELTEDDWRNYFLQARRAERVDMALVWSAMRALKMNTSHVDATSRIVELTADFEAILDGLDLEGFSEQEPKAAVLMLLNALEPPVFKGTVRPELSMECNRQYRKDVLAFLDWVTPKLHAFLQFEVEMGRAAGRDGRNQAAGPRKGSSKPSGLPERQNQRPGTTPRPAAASQSSRPQAAAPARPSPPAPAPSGCFKCGSADHGVYSCPDASREEAKALWDAHKRQRRARAIGAVVSREETEKHVLLDAVVNGGLQVRVMTDYGAAGSLMSPVLAQPLQQCEPKPEVRMYEEPLSLTTFAGDQVYIDREVTVELKFQTPGGPLVLQNVCCWIASSPLPSSLGDILLSRGIMHRLGYSPQRLINQAWRESPVFDCAVLEPSGLSIFDIPNYRDGYWQLPVSRSEHRPVPGCDQTAARREGENGNDGSQQPALVVAAAESPTSAQAWVAAPEESQWTEEEEFVCFPDLDLRRADKDRVEVLDVLRQKTEDAVVNGLSKEGAVRLTAMLNKYADVFRLRLGNDPPVDMPPLEVRLKPGAEPVRCKSRRYPAEQRAFMKQHVDELRSAGMVYRNPKSAWCSPPLIVKKQEAGAFRMTVDVRAVNAQTERLVWPMPVLEVILSHLVGSRVFFSLDFFKGYWQFLLAEASQELFSFLTDEGVFTPTRVLMGGSDSVAYCQSTVQEMFRDVLYKGLLVWLDDLLGYEKTETGLLSLLEKVLVRCTEKGLKLNPKKCAFFQKEALWCGKIVSADGIRHDPARVRALQDLPPPVTGGDLLQFVCAVNWMRLSIPAHNRIVEPLREALERVYTAAQGRTKRKAAGVRLSDVGWGPKEEAALAQVKEALSSVVALAHPDPRKTLCVFADASEEHWGAVVTQIPPSQKSRPLEEQEHEPLMFLSGTFSGAAKKWAIVEKEAFALVETCKRADYLLHGDAGFLLFTDHRNLRYIFDPHSVKAVVPKYTADKLQRWALLIMGYHYTIFDIPGDANVWADLLSRWGSTRTSICAIHLADVPLSPMLQQDFDWPGREQVVEAQRAAVATGEAPPTDHTQDADGAIRRRVV